MPKIFKDGTLSLLAKLEQKKEANPELTIVSLLKKNEKNNKEDEENKEILLLAIQKRLLKKRQQLVDYNNIPLDLNDNVEKYIKSPRYNNVFIAATPGFTYPAAKILLPGIDQSIVLAEGPTENNFSTLLTDLKANKVSTLVSIGLPHDGKEKFYDFLAKAEELTLRLFFEEVCKIDIPTELETSFKFYRYSEGGETFYIMHMPEWRDHQIPQFSLAELQVLGYFFEYVKDFAAHCSAGIGRSPAFIMAFLAYHYILKEHAKKFLVKQEILERFGEIIDAVLNLKPGTGDRLLTAWVLPGAEAIMEQMQLNKTPIKRNNSDQTTTQQAPVSYGAKFVSRKRLKSWDGTASSPAPLPADDEISHSCPSLFPKGLRSSN